MDLEAKLALGLYLALIVGHIIGIFISEGGLKILGDKFAKFIESRDQKRKGI